MGFVGARKEAFAEVANPGPWKDDGASERGNFGRGRVVG